MTDPTPPDAHPSDEGGTDERPAPGPPGPPAHAAAPRDPQQVRRHEAHLVAQIHHLIEANGKLEERLDRLAKVTEIADLFRQKKISRDTFELGAPELRIPADVQSAWNRIERVLGELPAPPEAPEQTSRLIDLRESLGIVRSAGWTVDPEWLAELRVRLITAEQAIAFLDEQTRELDQLREEKASIMDGVDRLEQTIEDLWKSLNEKTTHIQRLEGQLNRIWGSAPYRLLSAFRRLLRRGGGGEGRP